LRNAPTQNRRPRFCCMDMTCVYLSVFVCLSVCLSVCSLVRLLESRDCSMTSDVDVTSSHSRSFISEMHGLRRYRYPVSQSVCGGLDQLGQLDVFHLLRAYRHQSERSFTFCECTVCNSLHDSRAISVNTFDRALKTFQRLIITV